MCAFFAIDLEVYLKYFCTTVTLPMFCLQRSTKLLQTDRATRWREQNFVLTQYHFYITLVISFVLFFRQISLINSGFFFSKISIALLPIMKIKLMQPCIRKHTFETSMGGFWTLRDRNYFPVKGSGKQRFPFHCSIYTTLQIRFISSLSTSLIPSIYHTKVYKRVKGWSRFFNNYLTTEVCYNIKTLTF